MRKKITINKVKIDGENISLNNSFILYKIKTSNGIPVQAEGFLQTQNVEFKDALKKNKKIDVIQKGLDIELKYKYKLDNIYVYNEPTDFS